MDMDAIRRKAKEAEDNSKGMKKKINPKVLNMIERFVYFLLPSHSSNVA